MDHFDVATVMDFLEQRLPEPEMAACGVHMETCLTCAEMYRFWWYFLSTIESERLVNAPEQLIDRCIGIFPGAPRGTDSVRSSAGSSSTAFSSLRRHRLSAASMLRGKS